MRHIGHIDCHGLLLAPTARQTFSSTATNSLFLVIMVRPKGILRIAAETWLTPAMDAGCMNMSQHFVDPWHMTTATKQSGMCTRTKKLLPRLPLFFESSGDSAEFRSSCLAGLTFLVRKPHGIVPPHQRENGETQECGTPSSVTWDQASQQCSHTNVAGRQARNVTHPTRCNKNSAHGLPTFSNQTANDIAEVLMKAPTSIKELPNLSGCSIADCMEFVGPVCISLCGQQTDELIEQESFCFIASHSDRDDPVIMWNHLGHEFLNNTCPCSERHNRGLVAITKTECVNLGIRSAILSEGVFTGAKESWKSEQACQHQIDALELGWQRLHRVLGAGKPHRPCNSGLKVVGATYFPQDFLELHPNIVIVSSACGGTGAVAKREKQHCILEFNREDPVETTRAHRAHTV
jgi:hypothetical protein